VSIDLGILTGSLSPAAGGLFHSVRIPAQALASGGTKVTVYGSWDEQTEEARPAWRDLQVECFRSLGPARLGYSPAMSRRVLDKPHDVLHTHGIWFFPSYVSNAWRKRFHRPTIISPRGMLDPWALRKSAIKKRILRRLYEDDNLAGASALHALNDAEAAAFRAFGLRNPIAVIPNGVDLPDTAAPRPLPDFMANDRRKVLLFLARIHPKKGLVELIEAWRSVVTVAPAIGETWRLVIAGWDDGGHVATLDGLVRAHALERHVALVGPLYGESKAAALAHASAYILPSYSEGMPMSVLEAWSWRLPVFMTPACNLPEGYSRGAAFEIAAERDAMASVLHAALDDQPLLAAAGAAGRALVAERYTWDRIVADMRLLYDWVVGGGTAPDFVVADDAGRSAA